MLMQVTLVLILAGTVGLAELVTRQRNHSGIPELNQVQKIDRVLIKLPAGWDVSQVDPAVLIAQEPGADGQGRILMVRMLQVGNVRSPAEFLRRSGLLNQPLVIHSDGQDEPDDSVAMDITPVKMQPITMAGQQGVMTSVLRADKSLPGMLSTIHSELIAATVLPSKTAIVIQLELTEPLVDPNDERLVRQVAAALEVQGNQQP